MENRMIIAGIAIGIALITCIYFFIRQGKKQKQLVKENNLLKKELEDVNNQVNSLQVENSRFILNPHLFKNTLNSIQGYAFRTNQALEKLGGVLDYILYDSNKKLISLKEELEFARNFIELNKIKLNPLFDMRVNNTIEEHHPLYEQNIIVPMVTAYFIENAFKHADLQTSGAFITIEMSLSGDEFVFTVLNKINKTPVFTGKGGLGQENLKKRLDLTYGEHYNLEYRQESGIYKSELKLKLRDFKNKVPDIG
jgi:sensor histidine kinase YesM